MNITDYSDYSLRNIQEKDLPYYLDYFYHSPEGFIESLGVDLNKLPRKDLMKESFINRCKNAMTDPGSCPLLAITYDDQVVGILLLNCLNIRAC